MILLDAQSMPLAKQELGNEDTAAGYRASRLVCACLKEAIIAKKKGGAIDAKVENAVMT